MERPGDAFELGEQLTVVGRCLQVGDMAPAFELDHLDPDTEALVRMRLSDSDGKVRLLNIVNSLDTPVCQIETRRWDAIGRELPNDAILFTISMDLPYAQARWCGAEHATHKALSAHRDEGFATDYGVLIKEWRLLQRAVIVIGGDGRIRHAEYVRDQMMEPDYEAAKDAVLTAAVAKA